MLEALESIFKIPQYLLRLVESYLNDRDLIFDTIDGPETKKITAGAVEDSILGPDLLSIHITESCERTC